mgnify:CR=1 FL=1
MFIIYSVIHNVFLMKTMVAPMNLELPGVSIRLTSPGLSLPFTLIQRRKCLPGVEPTVVLPWITPGLDQMIGKVLGTSPLTRSIQSILRLITSTILGPMSSVLEPQPSATTSLMIWLRTEPDQASWISLTSDKAEPSGSPFFV